MESLLERNDVQFATQKSRNHQSADTVTQNAKSRSVPSSASFISLAFSVSHGPQSYLQ